MTFEDQLADAFDRGLRDGPDSLWSVDRELFRIQDFIVEFEIGGLSSYLYNCLPDLDGIERTVAAMRRFDLQRLAELLEQAAALFQGYRDPETPTTWAEVQRTYDPEGPSIR